MKITTYIKKHWAELPKSSFDSDSVVIVKEIKNEEYGYGHHSYEGLGVNEAGEFMWCYSSGCSCNGSCGTDHRQELKTLQVNGEDFNVADLDYKTIVFKDLQVTFTSY